MLDHPLPRYTADSYGPGRAARYIDERHDFFRGGRGMEWATFFGNPFEESSTTVSAKTHAMSSKLNRVICDRVGRTKSQQF